MTCRSDPEAAIDALVAGVGLLVVVLVSGAFVLAGLERVAGRHELARADRALCESRGGVWLTAPVEPGCYLIEEVGDE